MQVPITLYQRSKVAINGLLDRVIDSCDLILTDYYALRSPTVRKAVHSIARGIGDVCNFLRLFPRIPAYKLSGADWKIVYVGSEMGRQEICQLFFKNGADQQALGRVTLWQLDQHTLHWLADDADLVVCELSRFRLWVPRTPVSFTVPSWVQLELVIPEPPKALIAGRKQRGLANQIQRAQKSGLTYCFNQVLADFQHFYHHMYVPFVKSRHGDLAIVTPYPGLLRAFKRGGLVLIKCKDQAVAGSVCYMAGDICHWIESGVLDADPRLWQQGINTFQIWSKILWAHAQGAKVFDMGVSLASRSNGSLLKKQQWGARVAQRKRISTEWTFLARDLPSSLQEHINQLGFMINIKGKYYGVRLTASSTAISEADVQQETLTAKLEGLDGLAVICPHRPLKICR